MELRPLGRTGADDAAAGVIDQPASLPSLTGPQLSDLERVHDERVRAHVHDRW